MKRLLYTWLLSICLLTTVWAGNDLYTTKSALSTGKWVKMQVSETGIYKLTFAKLKELGFADPAKVSVHGYGGWPLEEDFSKPYIDDLPAVAVWKNTDFILFYAKGPRKWEYNPGQGFVHTNNPYSSYGYYFLTDAASPREMEVVPSVSGATLKITTFDDYWLHEEELYSVNKSGRELYGESFLLKSSQDFSFKIPGITNDEGFATLDFIAKPTTGTGTVNLSVNGNELIRHTFPNSPASDTYIKALSMRSRVTWTGNKAEVSGINIRYEGQTTHKNVNLNYIRLQMKRSLQPYGAYAFFRSLAASEGNASRFVIQNATAATLVFDVTDGVSPKQMKTELNGTERSFSIPQGSINKVREFALVQTNASFPSPVFPNSGKLMPPQDLHGLPQTDMVIIVQPALVNQAERLAEAHRRRDGLRVEVVTPEAIYNEFSSGTPDATAYRRFMKMFYDRATSSADAPKYLLLFGDGVYDNRMLTTEWKKIEPALTNRLLTFQTENSLDDASFVVDDYFGFLQDGSGKDLLSDVLEIGIGRFPVRTVNEATQVVDKVISYMDNKQTGTWKNKICFVADDGSNSDSFSQEHMTHADKHAEYLESDHPEFLVNKVYMDAYKKDFTGGETRYPDVNTNIQQLLKNGLLLINYTGHGNTEAWSDEKVLTHKDILLANYPSLPLWVTATCDFTRFDDISTTAGEDVFLNKTSGGIGLFTTTRVAYSDPNFSVNNSLIRNLFEKKEGKRLTLGEVMRYTKHSLPSTRYKLGFCLIGDPAMKLAYPEYQMEVTAVNGEPVTADPFTFKALEKITIEGKVRAPDDNLAADFSGLLNPTILDSRDSVTTLDNNKKGVTFKYADYLNTLFVGNDSVRNGLFRFTFTVPKDISYSNRAGKMNLYATDAVSGQEAQGAFVHFKVGGTSENADKDTVGPEIRALFLNDTTFTEGSKVNITPLFVAKLWDESGVNITGSSIGHDIVLLIDNQPVSSYNLNSYYESVSGREGEGLVTFLVPALAPGLHTAEFRVWDVQNNSTVRTFTFEVVEKLKPYLIELIASPTPARGYVDFHLFHNRPETRLRVGIMVYDMTGRLQWKHEESGTSDLFNAYTVRWDLTNGQGARLRPGIYLYRAAISSDHSKEATETKKLVILAQ